MNTDKEGRIASRFAIEDSARQDTLQRVRACSALSKPWVLPPYTESRSVVPENASQKLPEPYQTLGATGVTNLEGKALLSLWTPGWFRLEPDTRFKHSPNIDVRLIRQLEASLFLWELIIMSVLESAHLIGQKRPSAGFRSAKRKALTQILVTGDCLEYLDSDYRLTVFRRDQYVTRRNSAGDVLFHIVREDIDPLTLTDKQLKKAGLSRDELAAKPVADRMKVRHTEVEWDPTNERWNIRQELDKAIISETTEPVSPYFSTAYELAPGDHYGRGYMELKLGGFRSLNSLTEKLLDFAAAASKHHPIIDPSSELRPEDFNAATGTPFVDHVQNGVPTRVGMLKVDKLGDFNVVFTTWEAIRKDLAKSALLESEAQPQKERVTREQILGVRAELDGALGGVYSAIAEEQQVPLLQRVVYQCQKDNLLPTLKGDQKVQIKSLTGLEALTRAARAADLMETVQIIGQLGDAQARRIDLDVLVDVLARYRGLDEPGLLKSPERVAQEMQEEQRREVQLVAATEAAKAAGRIAEKQATGQ